MTLWANAVMTGFFALEIVFKIVVYGVHPFFHVPTQTFDFCVVCASIIEVAAGQSTIAFASALRSLRLMRVFSLAERREFLFIISTHADRRAPTTCVDLKVA